MATAIADDLIGDEVAVMVAPEDEALLDHIEGMLVVAHADDPPSKFLHHLGPFGGASMLHQVLHHVVSILVCRQDFSKLNDLCRHRLMDLPVVTTVDQHFLGRNISQDTNGHK